MFFVIIGFGISERQNVKVIYIHYSNTNIRENTLLEILQSPLFMAYHNNQPFNENHLRPCPMLENPEILQQLVVQSGAHSTDLQSPESAEHLCEKCREYADKWAPFANAIWKGSCMPTDDGYDKANI